MHSVLRRAIPSNMRDNLLQAGRRPWSAKALGSSSLRILLLAACGLLLSPLLHPRTRQRLLRLHSFTPPRVSQQSAATDSSRIVQPYRQLWQQLDQCGLVWQQQYIKLHNDVMSGRLPERIVVADAIPMGFADRMIGTISAFYYALLTHRAFQLHAWGELPGFELALAPNKIDWRRPADAEPLPPAAWNVSRAAAQFYGSANTNARHGYINHFDNTGISPDADSPDDLFMHGNMSNFPAENPNAAVVTFYSNRGRTVRLLENPYHAQQLWDWGLTPGNAFTCAFMFLFKPLEAVPQQMASTTAALQLEDPKALRIGVHIRLGDWEMDASGQTLSEAAVNERVAPVWSCVQEIEDSRHTAGQKVLWYLASDSLTARRAAKQRFGDKIITDTQAKVVHVACGTDRQYNWPVAENGTCQGDANRKAVAMQVAVGEILTLALTDVQCVPMNSGFGRLGAWLAREIKAIYSVPGVTWEGYQYRNCSGAQGDSVADMGSYWSMI